MTRLREVGNGSRQRNAGAGGSVLAQAGDRLRENGFVPPLASPYYATMNLHHFLGSRGVEIVGASRRVRGDVHKS